MTDHEDDIPSSHVEHFRSADTEPPPALQEAPTLPPPPVDEALAVAVASHVIAALAPQLTRLEKRVDELALLMNVVRTTQRNTEPVISAINIGVTGAFKVAGDAVKAAQHAADGILELDGKATQWLAKFERDMGARVVKIEDYLRKQGFGENDGSLATAAEGGDAE